MTKILVRIFFSSAQAQISHKEALRHILERDLAEMLSWELETFKIPRLLERKYAEIDKNCNLHEIAVHLFIEQVLKLSSSLPCDGDSFTELYREMTSRIAGAGEWVIGLLQEIASAYENGNNLLGKRISRNRYFDNSLSTELKSFFGEYVGVLLGQSAPVEFIEKLPLYITGLTDRIEMAFLEPAKYRRCIQVVKHFSDQVESAISAGGFDYGRSAAWKMRLQVEDLALSQFSHHSKKISSGTAERKLLQNLELLKNHQYV